MAHNLTMIYIKGVIIIKPTLVLVNLGTHLGTSLGHLIGTLDPSKILLPNALGP